MEKSINCLKYCRILESIMKAILILASIAMLLLVPGAISDGFSAQEKLPGWVKNIFIWYGSGQVSEDEVLNAIKFLIENNIIEIDLTDPETSTQTESMDITNVGGFDVSMASPVEGNANAPVTIIEFGDYQCGNCDIWFKNEKPTIKEVYLDTGKAKMYFLDFPFLGNDSELAAQASWCANEQGSFVEFHDTLYENQKGVEDGWANLDSLKQFASDLRLDTEQFNSCMDSGKFSNQVVHNKNIGLSNGVDRTPTFFIVGSDNSIHRIDGPQPAVVFQNLIDGLLN